MTRPFDVRPDLRAIPPYRVPQADAPVRLNTNESPWGPPDEFVDALTDGLARIPLNRYPDREARAVRDGLGARHGWPAEGIWPANGSNEVIQTLLLAFGGPERTVALFEPTYAMHSHIAHGTGTPVATTEIAEPWVLDPGTVARAAGSADLVFVCSPNNPTGTGQPISVVEAALGATEGLVIVDEAYGEFASDSAMPLLEREERLVVVRSFSKSWRLAGARIGYLVAHPWVVEAIQVVRLPYHLSALTQACAEIALEHAAAMLAHVAEIVAERDRLTKELERVEGVDVFPSEANFILFRTPREGRELWAALAADGVLVRDFSNVISRALRVTVGTSDQNSTFVESLRKVLAHGA